MSATLLGSEQLHSQFHFAPYSADTSLPLLDRLQPRLSSAFHLLSRDNADCRMLVVAGSEGCDWPRWLRQLVTEHPIAAHQGAREFTIPAVYQAKTGATSGDITVITPRDRFKLIDSNNVAQTLGYVFYDKATDRLRCEPGVLRTCHGGVVAIHAAILLEHPVLWRAIKHAVMFKRLGWYVPDSIHHPGELAADTDIDLRVVVYGSIDTLAALTEDDPEISTSYYRFVELAPETAVNDSNVAALLGWLALAGLPMARLNSDAQSLLLRHLARRAEHQAFLSLVDSDVALLRRAIAGIDGDGHIDGEMLQHAFNQEHKLSNYYELLSRDAVREGQIIVNTQGSVIGQVNGLSVVELVGRPVEFGEVVRLTATVHVGDGDLADVERRAELGGNIHAKSMMIIEGFIARLFAQQQALPFSGHLVFEQSYSEVDGDSASMAGLLAMLSALAKLPIQQHVALTGAVDQLGHVLAVGGVNEKIEAFFDICQLQPSATTPLVIIPAANQRHLNLKPEVVQAVADGHFAIVTAAHIEDTYPLLFEPQDDEDIDAKVLYQVIRERIAGLERDGDDESPSWWQRIWPFS